MAADSIKSFVIDGGEHSVQEVISKLGFIATIKPEEKVDVSTLSILSNTLPERVYRALVARGESRQGTLDFVRLTLGEAFDLAASYRGKESRFNSRISKMLIDAIAASKAGIESLTVTYADDRMFVSRVETLVHTLEAKIIDLTEGDTPEVDPEADDEAKADRSSNKKGKKKSNT